MHDDLFAQVESAILRGEKIALAAPRGFGKTTIILVAICWAIVYGHRRYIVLVCSTGKMAAARLRTLKRFFAREDGLLAADFPEACQPVIDLEGASQRAAKQQHNGRLTNLVWGTEEIQFADIDDAEMAGTMVVSRGLDSAIRGLVEGERRPDLVLLDDPQTRESAHSLTQTTSRRETIKQDIEGLVGPGQTLSVLSLWTVIAHGDLADEYTSDEQPSYWSMRYRALVTLPTDEALTAEYVEKVRDGKRNGRADRKHRAAHAWYLRHREEVEAGAEALWPANYIPRECNEAELSAALDTDDVAWAAANCPDDYRAEEVSAIQSQLNKIADMGWEAWRSELQNDPEDPYTGETRPLTPSEVLAKQNGLRRRRVPQGAALLTAFLDAGSETDVHWVVMSWRPGLTGDVIDYGRDHVRSEGDAGSVEASLREVLTARLDALTTAEYRGETDDSIHRVERCLVDSGAWTKIVYEVCNRHPSQAVQASKGYGGRSYLGAPKGVPRRHRGPGWWRGRTQRDRQVLVHYDADFFKTTLAERVRVPLGARGAFGVWSRRRNSHQTYAEHLSAEHPVADVKRSGEMYYAWRETPGHPANHWWDATVGCHVAAVMEGITLPGLEDDENTPTRKPATATRKPTKRRLGVAAMK